MHLKFLLVVLLWNNVWRYVKSDNAATKSQAVPSPTRTLQMDDGQKIWVFDEVMNGDELKSMLDYLTFPFRRVDFMHQDIDIGLKNGFTPFHCAVNETEFEEFDFFKKTKDLLEDLFGKKLYVNNIHGEFLHALDPKPPIREACDEDTYLLILFINPFWRHNDYGQISFYAETWKNGMHGEPRLEIVHTIHPKPARMVVWPSCVVNVAHPPSVNYFSNLLMLKMRLTPKEMTKTGVEEESVEINDLRFGDFKFSNQDADRKINYTQHLKRTYYDKEKRGIYVFDDLFTTEELRQLRQHLLSVGRPKLGGYDDSALEDHDNVQWLSQYNVTDFVETEIWTRVKEVISYISNEDQWYPYDVAMNFVRHSDHTRIHPDAGTHEYEYTYLLYLSEGTTQNDFGETVWFEQETQNLDGIHQFTHPGGEEYEPIAAVWPKFGRMVAFRNVIEHSARPLGSSYLGCRYTFAVKVGRNKRHVAIKRLYESMETVDMTDELQELNMELQSGMHDDATHSPLTLQMLEDTLKMTRDDISKNSVKKYVQLVETLEKPKIEHIDEL